MFQIKQKTSETVVDVVSRIRKHAGKIELSDQLINAAFINGLRAPLRTHVITQGITDLESSIRMAKIMECAHVNDDSDVSAILVETLKNNAKMQDEHMTQVKSLTEKVAALSANNATSTAAVGDGNQRQNSGNRRTYDSDDRRDDGRRQNYDRRYNNSGQRNYRPTPQRTQLENHDRLQEVRANQQQTVEQSPTQQIQNPADTPCGNCGRMHANRQDCYARGLECYNCHRIGHLSAYCRSIRQPNQQQY